MVAVKRVLVVDDDPVVARSFDRVLTGKGYAVITAPNGEEALRKLRDEKYDVVFTDIRMPGMSGLEMAEQVKARQPWLPVVIVTGYGTDANEERARAAGVSAFLHKPLSPEMIECTASEAMMAATVAAGSTATQEVAVESVAATAVPRSMLKSVGMMLAAPLLGLALVVAGPIAGLAALLWLGARQLLRHLGARTNGRVVKNVLLFAAAPFVSLVYIVAFPFVGLAVLVWTGSKALHK